MCLIDIFIFRLGQVYFTRNTCFKLGLLDILRIGGRDFIFS